MVESVYTLRAFSRRFAQPAHWEQFGVQYLDKDTQLDMQTRGIELATAAQHTIYTYNQSIIFLTL